MQVRVAAREMWSKYGACSLVFLSVLLCQPRGIHALGGGFGTIVMCVSLTATIACLFQKGCDTFAFSRLYRPYFVKWLSWFIAYSVISFVSFGLLGVCAIACLFGASDITTVSLLLFVLALPFPVSRLVTQMREDLNRLRQVSSKHLIA